MSQQGTGNRHALALAAAQATDLFVSLVADAHKIERRRGFFHFLSREKSQQYGAVAAAPQRAHENVCQSSQITHEPELLGDVTNKERQGSPRLESHVVVEYLHVAAAGF